MGLQIVHVLLEALSFREGVGNGQMNVSPLIVTSENEEANRAW